MSAATIDPRLAALPDLRIPQPNGDGRFLVDIDTTSSEVHKAVAEEIEAIGGATASSSPRYRQIRAIQAKRSSRS